MKACRCPARPICLDSRQYPDYRRRRYRCPTCNWRWTTIETLVKTAEGQRVLTKPEGETLKAVKEQLIRIINQLP